MDKQLKCKAKNHRGFYPYLKTTRVDRLRLEEFC